jgi:ectoine hydroxylase-related dioxygenase (phytanoyl-CoA dioxygenase family)
MNASIVRPLFEPGDALIFDQFLIHRTAASTDMTRDRYAIESWFFAPGAYPQRHLPLVY